MAEAPKLTGTQELTIRVSPDTLHRVEEEASEYGQSVEDYVSEHLEDWHKPESPEEDQIWWAMAELAKREGFLSAEESEKLIERVRKSLETSEFEESSDDTPEPPETVPLTINVSSDLYCKLEEAASNFHDSVEEYVGDHLDSYHEPQSPEEEREWEEMMETAEKEGLLNFDDPEKSLERARQYAQNQTN